MLTETAKFSADSQPPPSSTSLIHAARLDPKSGKALRTLMAKGMRERFADNLQKFANATGLSVHGVKNILEGKSDGSLSTVVKVCSVLKTPYEEVVGPELAKLARDRYAKPKSEKERIVPVPPPPSSPVIPRTESVNGLRVGAKVPRSAVTPHDIAALRRGEYDVAVLGRLLDEYEDMKTSLEKVKEKAFKEYLASLDG